MVGQAAGGLRFFVEFRNAAILVGLQHSIAKGLVARNSDTSDGNPCTRIDVLAQHLSGIHPIDMIGSEHVDVVRSIIEN